LNSCWTVVEQLLNSCWTVVEQLMNCYWTVVEQLLNFCWTFVELLLNCYWTVVEQLLNCCWTVVKLPLNCCWTVVFNSKLLNCCRIVMDMTFNPSRRRIVVELSQKEANFTFLAKKKRKVWFCKCSTLTRGNESGANQQHWLDLSSLLSIQSSQFCRCTSSDLSSIH